MSVPPGISGRDPKLQPELMTQEMITAELNLLSLGNFVPLNVKIDLNQFDKEIARFDDAWVDYLPRTDRVNNRQALSLVNLPGMTHKDCPSGPEAEVLTGRDDLNELSFNTPTLAYDYLQSLRPALGDFESLGRTFLVKCNMGGYFVPHRDSPVFPRESFRLVAFLRNCGPLQYDWIMDHDEKVRIEEGRVYYVNTRMTHRTVSWVDNSIHLISNIPNTIDNVKWLVKHIHHRH